MGHHEQREGPVEVEENSVRRVKRNVFVDIFHKHFRVTVDDKLKQQLCVDDELRSTGADTLTQQVFYDI